MAIFAKDSSGATLDKAHSKLPNDIEDRWYESVAMATVLIGGIFAVLWVSLLVWSAGRLLTAW
jgi:hypothetical protein